jgi:TetR/AcrR family transcriptional regulator, cholesterol catabolism regulator
MEIIETLDGPLSMFKVEQPSVSLRERHKQDKRERLRAAAWELFTTAGYTRTTTRDIAKRAGVAAGTVFLYAKDKADLLFLVFEHKLAQSVDEAFATLPHAAPLVDQLMHVFSRFFHMYDASPDAARNFVKELPWADGPNARRVNGLTFAFLERIAGLVESARAKREVRDDVTPLLAAQSVFALYYMALMSWLSGFSTLQGALDGALRPSFELLIQGMAPAPVHGAEHSLVTAEKA